MIENQNEIIKFISNQMSVDELHKNFAYKSHMNKAHQEWYDQQTKLRVMMLENQRPWNKGTLPEVVDVGGYYMTRMQHVIDYKNAKVMEDDK